MTTIKQIITLWWLPVALAAAGCQNKKPVAQIESSAALPTYAGEFPAELSAEMTRYAEDANKARDATGAFGSYPGALSEPDWAVVAEVYRNSDAEGRGGAYAARLEEARIAKAFFEREKEDINRRVSGAVKSAAEKEACQCELDVYGKVSYALKEAVERGIEERLEESNQAFVIIERNEKTLGKANAEALEKQAQDISLFAHVVFIEMPTIYADVERRLGEFKTVAKTLDEEIAAETARREAKETTKAEKKAIDEHLKALENAKSAIQIFEQEAKQLKTKAETEIPEIRKAYEDAFKALMDEVEKRQKAAPPAAQGAV